MKTVFLRVIEAKDKATALRAAIRDSHPAHDESRFEVDSASFSSVPRSPFAYWARERLIRIFATLPALEGNGRTAKHGAATLDDGRFLRLRAEVPFGASGWVPFAKGGVYSLFYADLPLAFNWRHSGREVKVFVAAKVGSASRTIRATDYYFRPGLTWPLRTNGFSVRAMPAGCIFGHKGPAVFVEDDDHVTLLAICAVAGSQIFEALVSLQLARTELAQSYEVGLIQSTPVPQLSADDIRALALLSSQGWSKERSLDSCTEVSHSFFLPALLQSEGDSLEARVASWLEHVRDSKRELTRIREEIDQRCFALYEIDENDRRIISNFVARDVPECDGAPVVGHEGDEALNDGDATERATELVSWAVGVAFGRFDARLATGDRSLPPDPDPFDALPACSPGMLAADDGMPVSRSPAGYSVDFPETGVHVDDPGHTNNLAAAARAVFDLTFGDQSDAWWNEVSEVLDQKSHDLRTWLRAGFFQYHLKLYSKSRRKAPIYWQLATPSLGYSVWLYAHRLTRDSFFQIQNDVVAPKLAHEERKLASLVQGTGGSPSAKERKEIAAQESFVEELRAMLEEVKRVAPLWNPNLHDGGVLTMAPLWRLVPQHKSWQKELRSRWDELCAGKYDWAHVAMHLWPERVVPQCAKDRSLAIAHEIEDVFWVEGDDGKWTARPEPTQPVDELVKERTSSAVKAALASLLEAPVPGTSGRRSRRGHRRAQT